MNGNFALSQQRRQSQYYCHYCYPNLSKNKEREILSFNRQQKLALGICICKCVKGWWIDKILIRSVWSWREVSARWADSGILRKITSVIHSKLKRWFLRSSRWPVWTHLNVRVFYTGLSALRLVRQMRYCNCLYALYRMDRIGKPHSRLDAVFFSKKTKFARIRVPSR